MKLKSAILHPKLTLKPLLITYYSELGKAVDGSKSVLDVGCGMESPLKFLKNRPEFSVGIDGFKKSLLASKQQGIHDEYHHLDIMDIDKKFEPNSFDCVLASDVIEHLSKDQGLHLIDMMEKISSNRVIIFTPNGFQPQCEHSHNILQRHHSGWEVEEMFKLGYEVIGINGWKPLLGELARPRFHPKIFWAIISRFTQPWIRNHPKYAFQILCVKKMLTI